MAIDWTSIRPRVKPLTTVVSSLKLTDQVMKLLEWVLDISICKILNIDERDAVDLCAFVYTHWYYLHHAPTTGELPYRR